ncbi:restriction endonuclease subunit S [Vibrio kanaloae]|uniref:restriction endonuclease subunit S n=1 Tax=Vibrio kanaloae TaxID=170673 RepID=UPI00164877CA|nr:restriction endonuclease subunit S [Vibrio kanaloae]
MVNSLPWELVPFESLLLEPLRNGIYKKKEFHGRGCKIVNMGELFSYPRLNSSIDMNRVELTEKEKNKSLLLSGDLIFARRSLTAEGAGKCSLIRYVNEDTTFESSIIRARLEPKKADPEFYYYLFNSPVGKWLLGTILRQTAVSGITGGDLAKLIVPKPSLAIQKIIAQHCRSLDDKTELNNQINQTLEQMAQTLFKSWFVDFDPVKTKMNGEQPKGMDATTASLFPEKLVESELGLIPEGWDAVQVGDIVQRLKPKKRYTKKQVEPYGKTPVYEQGASILLGFHNDDAGFDASPEDPVFIFGDHTCITHLSCSKFDISSNVIPLKGSVRPTIWTYYALQGKQEFQEYRRHWSEFIIKDVVLPPVELAEKYAELVTTKYLMMESLKRQSKELEQLRDTLLPKLLSGEVDLDAPDSFAEDKLISKLLEQLDFGIEFKLSQQNLPKGYIGFITVSGTFGSNGGTHVHVPTAVKALSKLTTAEGAYGEIAGNVATETLTSGAVELVTNNIIPLGVLTKVCTAVFGKKTPIKPKDAVLLTTIHEATNKSIDGILNEQAKRFAFLELPCMDEQELEQSLQYLESIGVVKSNGKTIVLLDSIVQH